MLLLIQKIIFQRTQNGQQEVGFLKKVYVECLQIMLFLKRKEKGERKFERSHKSKD